MEPADVGIYSIAVDGEQIKHLQARGYVIDRAPADGSILYAPSYEQLAVMKGDGSGHRTLVRLHGDRVFSVAQSPWSPGGSEFAVSISPPDCEEGCVGWSVWIVDLATGARRRALANAAEASWSPDGRTLAFTNPVFPEYTGADHIPVPPHHVFLAPASGGRRLLLARGRAPVWRPGEDGLVYAGERTYQNPEDQNAMNGMWTTRPETGAGRRFAKVTGEEEWVLSPDGKQLAYTRFFGGLAVTPVDGGTARYMAPHAGVDTSPSWSPDGTTIAWGRYDSSADLERLMIIPADGSAKPRELVRTPAGGRFAGLVFSGNGRRIIFSVIALR